MGISHKKNEVDSKNKELDNIDSKKNEKKEMITSTINNIIKKMGGNKKTENSKEKKLISDKAVDSSKQKKEMYISSVDEENLNRVIEKNKSNEENFNFFKKIIKPSIMKSMMVLSIVPIVLLGIVIIVMVNSILTKTTENDVEKNLQGAALTVLIAYNQNPGDYMMGTDGNVWKGNFNVGTSDDLLSEISEASNIDIAFYTKDKCIISTLEDNKSVPKNIKETVIDKGYDYFSTNYNVNGKPSYVYAITVFQERSDEVVGMIVVSADKESREKSKKEVLSVTAVCTFIGVLAMALAALFIARGLVVSLKDGITSINEVSNGKLNIEFKRKHFKRKDELGLMYNSVATLVKELRRMINNSIIQTRKIMKTSENIDNTAEKTKDSIKKVNSAMVTMTETAESQFFTSNKVVENVEVLKDMIENTYNEIQDLNYTKENMQNEGSKVNKVVNELMYINDSLNEIVKIINSQIEMTHNSAKKIRKSAEMISSFADETNLLALNASIEAARAGEAGKGFSIVAKEVKELADQSNIVSMNISKEIGDLVKDSNKSLNSMNEVNAIVGRLNNTITVTEAAVGSINVGIENVSVSVDSIESRIKRMEKASKAILKITDELKNIAEKNSRCASDTSSVTDYMSELFDEAIELKYASDELAESMRVFKL